MCDISSLRVNGPSEPGRLRDVCICQWVNQLETKSAKITETRCFTNCTSFPDNHKFPSLTALYKCITDFLLLN